MKSRGLAVLAMMGALLGQGLNNHNIPTAGFNGGGYGRGRKKKLSPLAEKKRKRKKMLENKARTVIARNFK